MNEKNKNLLLSITQIPLWEEPGDWFWRLAANRSLEAVVTAEEVDPSEDPEVAVHSAFAWAGAPHGGNYWLLVFDAMNSRARRGPFLLRRGKELLGLRRECPAVHELQEMS